MPNTYSQIYIHLVFAVKYRQSLINESWETELYKYINGVIQNKGQLPIAINGMPDHIHILLIMKPTCCISDLVREIKKSSTEFITVKGYVRTKFQWQHGFGAFSYSQSSLDNVKRYIENQKQHHAVKTFKREYQNFSACLRLIIIRIICLIGFLKNRYDSEGVDLIRFPFGKI